MFEAGASDFGMVAPCPRAGEDKDEQLALHQLNIQHHDGIKQAYDAVKLFLQLHQPQPHQQVVENQQEAAEACLLFIARAVCSEEDPSVRRLWPLSKIVNACGTNLFYFFRELPVKALSLTPFLEQHGTSWSSLEASNHIKECQTSLISITLLSRKFKDLVARFLPDLGGLKQAVLRMGWTLFLALKSKLLSPYPDLVSCMTILACVLDVLLAHGPSLPDSLLQQQQQQQPPPPPQQQQQQQQQQQLDLLRTICGELKMDFGAVAQQMVFVDALLLQLLPSFVPEWRNHREPHPAAAQVETRCAHFSGLLTDPRRLQACADGLDREYSCLYNKQGEIDEREFLLSDAATLASPFMSPHSVHNTAKRLHMTHMTQADLAGAEAAAAFGAGGQAPPAAASVQLGPGAFFALPGQAGAETPAPVPAAAAASPVAERTPVSEAMAAASWLRAYAGTGSGVPAPSPRLAALLEAAAGPAAAADVARRAQELADAALPDDRPRASSMLGFPHVAPSLTAVRRTDMLRLYFRSLEAILLGEAPSGEAALKLLLSSPKFHKGLMACCLEVVAATFRMTSCSFPLVLERIQLQAFDLSRIVQAFVKHLPQLPRDVQRHLFAIEERVVEELAWHPGSPLFGLLAQAAAGDGTAAAAAAPVAVPAKRARDGEAAAAGATTAGAATASPPPLLPLAAGRPPAAGCRGGAALLHEFLRKVLQLSCFRLAQLVEHLSFSPLDRRSVYLAVQLVLDHTLYCHTHLYYNRHADQLMLCALYAYCKVQKLDQVTFKDIIAQYKRQPQASQTVFRSVNLGQSNPGLVPSGQADIITFYNQCYVAELRPFLLQLGSKEELPPPPPAEAAAAEGVAAAAPQLVRCLSGDTIVGGAADSSAGVEARWQTVPNAFDGVTHSPSAVAAAGAVFGAAAESTPGDGYGPTAVAVDAQAPSSAGDEGAVKQEQRGVGGKGLQRWKSLPGGFKGGKGGLRGEVGEEPAPVVAAAVGGRGCARRGSGAGAPSSSGRGSAGRGRAAGGSMPAGIAALLWALDSAEAQQPPGLDGPADPAPGPGASAATAAVAHCSGGGPPGASARSPSSTESAGHTSPLSDHSTFCPSPPPAQFGPAATLRRAAAPT